MGFILFNSSQRFSEGTIQDWKEYRWVYFVQLQPEIQCGNNLRVGRIQGNRICKNLEVTEGRGHTFEGGLVQVCSSEHAHLICIKMASYKESSNRISNFKAMIKRQFHRLVPDKKRLIYIQIKVID